MSACIETCRGSADQKGRFEMKTRNPRVLHVIVAVAVLCAIVSAGAWAQTATMPTSRPAAANAERIAANFAMLMTDNWEPIVKFVGTTILWMVVWAVGLFVVGIFVGLVMYLILRRLTYAPWRWYRYVRWLWPVGFVLTAALALGYAGLWLGPSRNIKSYIREQHMLDRVVSHVAVAALLDKADYEVSGHETAEDLAKVLSDSRVLQELTGEDFSVSREELISSGDDFAQRWVLKLATETEAFKLVEALRKVDPQTLMTILTEYRDVEAYLAEHPDAGQEVQAVAAGFGVVREQACELVDTVAMPNVWGAVAIGLLAPAGLAIVFGVIVRLVSPRRGSE